MARRTKDILKEYFASGAIPSGDQFSELIDSMVESIGFEEVTVSAGAITRTQINHKVDTEADAATDDIDTINGGADGEIVRLMCVSESRVPTLKDGTDNLDLGGDIALNSLGLVRALIYVGATSKWVPVS